MTSIKLISTELLMKTNTQHTTETLNYCNYYAPGTIEWWPALPSGHRWSSHWPVHPYLRHRPFVVRGWRATPGCDRAPLGWEAPGTPGRAARLLNCCGRTRPMTATIKYRFVSWCKFILKHFKFSPVCLYGRAARLNRVIKYLILFSTPAGAWLVYTCPG